VPIGGVPLEKAVGDAQRSAVADHGTAIFGTVVSPELAVLDLR
jgi:hypothetical protein